MNLISFTMRNLRNALRLYFEWNSSIAIFKEF